VIGGGFKEIMTAPPGDRLNLFLSTAQRLGTPVQNIEKDFWVCWTLYALYHGVPTGSPRLLFKGGTSLSKAYGLIRRFSEDIDITVFRDDLEQPASVEELEALSGKKRGARLDAIRDACRSYIGGVLRDRLAFQLKEIVSDDGRVEIDPEDQDQQSLLIWYPTVTDRDVAYIRPAVRIESGAKSALDPHQDVIIQPYIADETPNLDLAVTGVTTIEASRTLWDKIVIAHGLRRWHDKRGELRQEGQRVSRHYYDLHCLIGSKLGRDALADLVLGADCVRHARMFFDRRDYDLASAKPGSFAIEPSPAMIEALQRDYVAMTPMVFGQAPRFEDVLASVREVDNAINRRA
jgi:hypothetical protein